jgi:flavin-dependent dehydrogenase
MSTRNDIDVVVVGAGVGGAVCALALAQRGARVTLLEAARMPRHKVCGEFLSPEIKAIFARLQILHAIEKAGAARVQTARIVSGHRVLETSLSGDALALSRWRMDAVLWQAAQDAGVQCCHDTRARGIEGNARDGFVVSAGGAQWRARFVVAAAGRNARLPGSASVAPDDGCKRYIGFKAHFRDVALQNGSVELHPFNGGYCGLVHIEDGLTNVCLLADYEVVAGRRPAQFWEWLLQNVPSLRACAGDAQPAMPWLATANITFGAAQPLHGDVLRCGDAAGFIHPLTGDGMAMAARSGELAAAVVGAGLRGGLAPGDVPLLYAAAWQREFAQRLKWGARLQPLLTSPHFSTLAISLLNRLPRVAQRVVALTRG